MRVNTCVLSVLVSIQLNHEWKHHKCTGNRVNIDETDVFVLGDIEGKVNASEGI